MNHLKQVNWNVAMEQRLHAAEEKLLSLLRRVAELEAKRGPGRPKVERDTAGNDRKV
jgi:hypothetical protein